MSAKNAAEDHAQNRNTATSSAMPDATGWGNVGSAMDPDGSGIHSPYMYLGGVGQWSNQTDGSNWWHGWVAYDSATYASYDDPDGIGPVLTLGHRARHDESAILTDRMWLTDQGNLWDPYRKAGK